MEATVTKQAESVAKTETVNRGLDAIFYPKSVAVVGVTQTPGTVPYDIFHNILASGYTGVLYPVAPGKRSISAVPAYRYVSDIENDVDLAVVVFPANVVERALAVQTVGDAVDFIAGYVT